MSEGEVAIAWRIIDHLRRVLNNGAPLCLINFLHWREHKNPVIVILFTFHTTRSNMRTQPKLGTYPRSTYYYFNSLFVPKYIGLQTSASLHKCNTFGSNITLQWFTHHLGAGERRAASEAARRIVLTITAPIDHHFMAGWCTGAVYVILVQLLLSLKSVEFLFWNICFII